MGGAAGSSIFGGAGMAGAGPVLSGTPDGKAEVLAALAVPCNDPLASVYFGAVPPSPWDASHRGDIVKCAYDRLVTKQEMDDYYAGGGVTLGAQTDVHKLVISYWTEREVGVPILVSAELMIPAVRVASPSPLLAVGHGTVGEATECAPSLEPATNNDQIQTYLFASSGWVVLAPDYPGLGTSGTTAWQYSPDEGHSLLDATQAARKVTKPGFFSTHNVVLGHSQGGHAAISAQAYANTYGTNGSLDAVVAYAPAYFSNAAYAALITDLAANLGAVDSFTLFTSIMYIRGHLAAIEGEAHKDDAFLPAMIPQIEAAIASGCLDAETAAIGALGVTKGSQLFTQQFVQQVGNCGALGSCASPLGMTWKQRFVVDRPAADPTIPLVLWAGGKDDTVTPGYAQCGIDRLSAETNDFAACGDANADHQTIIATSADWVRQYIAAVTLGYGYPAPCTPFSVAVPGIKCQTPPANNATDPTLP
jgi:hypothetical protein